MTKKDERQLRGAAGRAGNRPAGDSCSFGRLRTPDGPCTRTPRSRKLPSGGAITTLSDWRSPSRRRATLRCTASGAPRPANRQPSGPSRCGWPPGCAGAWTPPEASPAVGVALTCAFHAPSATSGRGAPAATSAVSTCISAGCAVCSRQSAVGLAKVAQAAKGGLCNCSCCCCCCFRCRGCCISASHVFCCPSCSESACWREASIAIAFRSCAFRSRSLRAFETRGFSVVWFSWQ
mmetsp:Transcript_42688/g.118836  ORF Transcript_42688/g.118836 Transcript_42688/m.118836 type:complete len:235 (-) Transcript_42688:382-1086(-)